MKASDLSYVVINTKSKQDTLTESYKKIYELWKSVWLETFKNLDDSEKLYSDNFSRQDEIIALFHNHTCVGCIFHRYGYEDDPVLFDDSYFEPWSKFDIQKLKNHGPKICIGSNITVHPEYRGRRMGLSIKELLTHLSLAILIKRNVDVITGIMRADKGMDTLFYDCGAIPINQNVSYHNVPVHLVAFFPKTHPIQIYHSLINQMTKESNDDVATEFQIKKSS